MENKKTFYLTEEQTRDIFEKLEKKIEFNAFMKRKPDFKLKIELKEVIQNDMS